MTAESDTDGQPLNKRVIYKRNPGINGMKYALWLKTTYYRLFLQYIGKSYSSISKTGTLSNGVAALAFKFQAYRKEMPCL